MKGIMIISIIAVAVAGLIVGGSELGKPFTGAADLNTTLVANQHQDAINTIDELTYQNQAEGQLAIQDAQAQAEVDRIQAEAARDQALGDAQNQAALAEIERSSAQADALSQQAVQHDWEIKQAEAAQVRAEGELKLQLMQVGGYAAISVVAIAIMAISIGLAVRLAHRTEKWSEEQKKSAVVAARAIERRTRQQSIPQPQPAPPQKVVVRPNGNGHKEHSNTPYNELPRAE